MPLWRTPCVDAQPTLILTQWRILQIQEGPARGQKHLCGYCPINRESRCSTAIVSIDTERRRCTTRSGRIYKLHGPSDYDPDAAYVWYCWTGGISTVDVSQDVLGVVAHERPRVHDLPTDEQEEFSKWLIGRPVPGDGLYFLCDYKMWKEDLLSQKSK